jgi:hypothetical protein
MYYNLRKDIVLYEVISRNGDQAFVTAFRCVTVRKAVLSLIITYHAMVTYRRCEGQAPRILYSCTSWI